MCTKNDQKRANVAVFHPLTRKLSDPEDPSATVVSPVRCMPKHTNCEGQASDPFLLANTFSLTFACHILTFSDNEHIYSHFRMSCTHFSNNVDPANSPGFPYQSFQLSHAIAVKRLLTYVKRKKIYIGITPNKYDRAP